MQSTLLALNFFPIKTAWQIGVLFLVISMREKRAQPWVESVSDWAAVRGHGLRSKEMDGSVQFGLVNLFLLLLHMINRHVLSKLFEIYNSVEFFTRLNSGEHFLRMSVRETSLPGSYKIFSKKWNRNLRAGNDLSLIHIWRCRRS